MIEEPKYTEKELWIRIGVVYIIGYLIGILAEWSVVRWS